ncbi:MAG: DUF3185 domain-containing protein [Gemmatimonadota bacterium]|jgi:hypothetical protein
MQFRISTILGLLLVVAGAVSLALGGVPYTEEEQVVDVGPIEASTEVDRELEVPPLVGGIVLAAGAGLVVFGVTRET